MTTGFRLGGGEPEYLEVRIHARSRPAAIDYWDANWLEAEVEIVAGPWRGAYRAALRADEFGDFRRQLDHLYDEIDAPPARFEAMEPWLRFEVKRSDRAGHVEVRGKAQREPFFEAHNVLFFALDLDQTYLPPAIQGLRNIEMAYPVIGSPDDPDG